MSDQRLIEIATSLGRMEGKLDEALKSDRERIGKLEAAQTRAWWMTYAITPLLFALQAGLRKLGVQI